MATSAKAVANEFLTLAKRDKRKITPMQIQKLAYFAHGWYLALRGRPLLDETIEAWNYGPVVRSLYHSFKGFGSGPITQLAGTGIFEEGTPAEIPDTPEKESVQRVINRVWEVYGRFDALTLSEMTHQEDSPWSQIVAEYNGEPPKGTDIPNKLIQEYFERQRGRTS